MNIALLSFADKRYKTSLEKIEKDTETFPFTHRAFLTEDNLSRDYLKILRYKTHRRGFGYWKWKSYLVKEYLHKLKDGDILVYSDVGVYWNKAGIKKFEEYINETIEHGILSFQQPFLEKDWTKGDIFKELDVLNNPKILMSLQLWGGCFMMIKNQITIDLVDKWCDLCENKYDLITDKHSVTPNIVGFRENRHDQSLFSVLVKTKPHIEISWDEVYSLNTQWQNFDEYPIQGRRTLNSNQSLSERIIRLLSYPYRWIIGWYLEKFKDMYFAYKKSW